MKSFLSAIFKVYLSLQFVIFILAICHCQPSSSTTSTQHKNATTTATATTTTTTTAKTQNTTGNKYPHSDVYEAHASQALNIAIKRMQAIYNRKRELFYSLTQGRAYNVNQAPIKQEIDKEYRIMAYELAGNLSVIPVQQLQNATLRRQVQRLSKLQLYGLGKRDFEQAKELLHTMQTFITSRLVCMEKDCQPALEMIPTIKNKVMRTRKYIDLENYWLKWRQTLAERDMAKSTFIDFVRLLRVAATYNGK